ncbi:MAG: hypothetical protein WB930_21280 [Syntrophobacteraceae bacterium]
MSGGNNTGNQSASHQGASGHKRAGQYSWRAADIARDNLCSDHRNIDQLTQCHTSRSRAETVDVILVGQWLYCAITIQDIVSNIVRFIFSLFNVSSFLFMEPG